MRALRNGSRSHKLLSFMIAGVLAAGLLAACSDDSPSDDANSSYDADELVPPANPVVKEAITLANGQVLSPGPICMYFVDRTGGESPIEAAQAACADSGIEQSRWIEESNSAQPNYQPPATVINITQPNDYVYHNYTDFLVWLWIFHTANSFWYSSPAFYNSYVPFGYRSQYQTTYVTTYNKRYQSYETRYAPKTTYQTRGGKTVTADKADPKKFPSTKNTGGTAKTKCSLGPIGRVVYSTIAFTMKRAMVAVMAVARKPNPGSGSKSSTSKSSTSKSSSTNTGTGTKAQPKTNTGGDRTSGGTQGGC